MEIEYANSSEKKTRTEFVDMLKKCPISDDQLMANLGIFLTSKTLARILFMNHIYEQIINVPGVVMEFGTRWGQNSALFSALRGIYEPFHRHRKIICFDTFCGFTEITNEDGKSPLMQIGNVSTTEGYEAYLSKILELHEKDNPISHIKKFEVIKGNAESTLHQYLSKHPQTIVALAYFDFDLYKPTEICLEMIKPHLTKGSVLAFDELNDEDSPGETQALQEAFGLNNIKLRRLGYVSRVSYFVVEEVKQ